MPYCSYFWLLSKSFAKLECLECRFVNPCLGFTFKTQTYPQQARTK